MRDPAAAMPVVSPRRTGGPPLAGPRQHGHDPIAARLDDHDLIVDHHEAMAAELRMDRHDVPRNRVGPHRARNGRADRHRDLRARQRPHVHAVDALRESRADARALLVGHPGRATRCTVLPRCLPRASCRRSMRLPRSCRRVELPGFAAARCFARHVAFLRLTRGGAFALHTRLIGRARRAGGALSRASPCPFCIRGWSAGRSLDWPVVDLSGCARAGPCGSC